MARKHVHFNFIVVYGTVTIRHKEHNIFEFEAETKVNWKYCY